MGHGYYFPDEKTGIHRTPESMINGGIINIDAVDTYSFFRISL